MIRHFVYSLLLRASIPAFGVINFMVIVRLFDEDQVGVWVLYMTILALIEVAKEGFLKNATIWLLNKEAEEQTDSILSSSLRLNLITTLTICVAVVAAATVLVFASDYALLGYLLLLFVFQLLLNTLFNHFDYYLTSQAEFKQMMWAYLIKSFSLFALLICSFVFWKSSVSLEWLVGFQTVGVILSILFLARKYDRRLTLGGADKQFSRRIVGFGRYVFATNVSSVLFRSTDHYMLAGLIGTGSVAYYNVALRITNLVDLPSTAAAEVIFPMSVKSSDPDELKKIYERTVGYILSLAIPFTLFILLASEHIVQFIAGPSYSASVEVFRSP